MSSKYDIIHINPQITLPDWDLPNSPSEVEFQSKTFKDAFCLRNVHLALDGIYVENFEMVETQLEDRPAIKEKDYEDPKSEASPMEKAFGSLEKTNISIEKRNYTGEFTFYRSNPTWHKYVAVYEDGNLKEIVRVQ